MYSQRIFSQVQYRYCCPLPGEGLLDEVNIGDVHFGTHSSANVVAQGTTSTNCYTDGPHPSLDLPSEDGIDFG